MYFLRKEVVRGETVNHTEQTAAGTFGSVSLLVLKWPLDLSTFLLSEYREAFGQLLYSSSVHVAFSSLMLLLHRAQYARQIQWLRTLLCFVRHFIETPWTYTDVMLTNLLHRITCCKLSHVLKIRMEISYYYFFLNVNCSHCKCFTDSCQLLSHFKVWLWLVQWNQTFSVLCLLCLQTTMLPYSSCPAGGSIVMQKYPVLCCLVLQLHPKKKTKRVIIVLLNDCLPACSHFERFKYEILFSSSAVTLLMLTPILFIHTEIKLERPTRLGDANLYFVDHSLRILELKY